MCSCCFSYLYIASTTNKNKDKIAINNRADFIDSNDIGDESPDAVTEAKLKQLSSDANGSGTTSTACQIHSLVSTVITIAFSALLISIRQNK